MDVLDPLLSLSPSTKASIHAFLDNLGSLTVAEIWNSINYHPKIPRPISNIILAYIVIQLFYKLGRWYAVYTESRKIYKFDYPAPKEADPAWKGRIIENPSLFSHEKDQSLLPSDKNINGKTTYLTCYDPSTAYHLATIPLPTIEQVNETVRKAHEAQSAWARTSFSQRQSVLRSLKAWVMRDIEDLLNVACRDTGKIRTDAYLGDILMTLCKIDWLLKYGEKSLKPQQRPVNLILAHKLSHIHYHPLGTVLACVSWNYSFHNLISPVLAALYSGNTVVVKCSEQVAWSSMWYMGGIKACLRACGMDEEVVQLVVCLPDVADKLTRNPLIKHITFSHAGKERLKMQVAAAAADIMVPTCIELGGKDPAFILPSANLKQFVSTWLRGAFQAAGQNCIGIELFLIPRSRVDEFISLVLPRVRQLQPGRDISSLISHTPIKRLEDIIAKAQKSGAKLLVGGKQYHHPDFPHAAYFEPTMITDVKMDMDIAKEELFGPVLTIVPYDSVKEAQQWLKESRFGLGAGVYGDDKEECQRVAEALECGMISINDFGVFYMNQAMPFGGVKASGHGRFGGEEGLRSLCYAKNITKDRFFSWIRTPIPPPVDYPVTNPAHTWGFLSGLTNLVYGSPWERLQGLIRLIKNVI